MDGCRHSQRRRVFDERPITDGRGPPDHHCRQRPLARYAHRKFLAVSATSGAGGRAEARASRDCRRTRCPDARDPRQGLQGRTLSNSPWSKGMPIRAGAQDSQPRAIIRNAEPHSYRCSNRAKTPRCPRDRPKAGSSRGYGRIATGAVVALNWADVDSRGVRFACAIPIGAAS